jgi:2-phosphoglycerate kinase
MNKMTGGITNRAPRLLLISGVSGVGKSTLATQVASALKFDRIAGSDTVREVLRTATTPSASPALFRSTFSSGVTGDSATDWLDACSAVEAGLEAVIARARREGIDLIVEGAHIIPSNRILADWKSQGGVAIGLTLTIDNASIHQERIEEREVNTHRGASRYLASFDRIRAIQTALITRAKGVNWKVIDTHLQGEFVEKLRQQFDEEWYKLR